MAVQTPLPPDTLLLVGFSGNEGLSQLFNFRLDLIADNYRVNGVAFDKLLGKPITVRLELPGQDEERYFNGICNRLTQGESDEFFTRYTMEVVPRFWLWTKRAQSRIFQHLTVPEILKKVLDGLDVHFELPGAWEQRDFCVQYRETDAQLASRLMAEEGIFYFFKHTKDGHQMVVANTPQSHPDLPSASTITYRNLTQATAEGADIIYDWSKSQEITAGKVTLWDHCFELPHMHLETDKMIKPTVAVGGVTHHLDIADHGELELYDWPGEYAQRFDGVDKGGSERAQELQKIFEDNKRTAKIRMEQEAVRALTIQGASNCRQLVSGHKFTLTTLPADPHTALLQAEGKYVLTGVSHSARQGGDYRSGGADSFEYSNRFTCIPVEVPFRPPRSTPKPVVHGSQTAVVVGPPGEEIFTDKYGRVKVQFHWDREGKHNTDSSCWIRVSTIWAGKGWGIVNVPRIGHEVIVDFLEGDPDQPIIIGSVYNAKHMPPDELPKTKMVSGLKSNSTPGGGGYNGLIFNDTKKKEKITLHGQYDMDTTIEHDDTQHIKNDRTINVDGKHTETIKKDTSIIVSEGNLSHDVAKGTAYYHVKGAVQEKFEDSQDTVVKNGIHIASETAHIYIHTATNIQLHVGDSNIWMDSGGQIAIKGNNIAIEGKESVSIHGGMVRSKADSTHEIEGGNVISDGKGSNTVKGGMVMLNP
jgi:type VI secretion system secreted protein VgrG